MKRLLRLFIFATAASAIILVVAGVLVFLSLPPVHAKRERTPLPTSNGEASWLKVLRSDGHKVHVFGLEPVACKKCHDLKAGTFQAPSEKQCLECHPENPVTVHASPKAKEKSDCADCHSFVVGNAGESPWSCQHCHEKEQGEKAAIVVHGKEQCGKCHRPHGEPALAPRDCVECHKDEAARHGRRTQAGAKTCLDCHDPHDKAGQADGRCMSCHQEKTPTVPATAVQPGKHEKCTGCHKPHQFTAAAARDCRSCHDDRRVVGEEKVAEHRACDGCHEPHAPLADMLGSCAKCHQKLAPSHPRDEKRGTCLGCHDVHPKTNVPTVAGVHVIGVAACSRCHEKATSDTAFHNAGVRCSECHAPHKFKDPRECGECHEKHAARTAAMPSGGHRDCTKCHKEPHRPLGGVPTCRDCHEEVAHSAPKGHDECTKCHTPHDPARSKMSACANCHKDRATKLHGAVEGGCSSCHKPHGPLAGAPRACTSCHEPGRLPLLHAVKDHRKCGTCHGAHESPKRDRATCASCHKEQARHEPNAEACTGCHAFGGKP
ncbi:MAG: hypothetical protein HY698_17530 [Deltaproteobacteria bacterium]|nr:hypothetical protein [Deltaproteobacteria bacterium]